MREGLPSKCEGYSGKVLVFLNLCTIKLRKIIWFFYEVAIKYVSIKSNRMNFRVLPDRGEVLCTRGKHAPANKGILEWKSSSPDARPYAKLH